MIYSKNLTILSFFVIALITQLKAQEQEVLFPNLAGEELLSELVNNYKPVNILDYRNAREYLYQTVYNVDNFVECVYTGHSIFLPPDEDNPIFHLARFGSLNGIITEHTYPQSKGAETGNPESNMHHLVPARLAANVARLNYPFGEIDDEQTDLWLINDQSLNAIPSTDLDLYSEQIRGRFEPKEQHKGNVARMIFYFYTMYKAEALEADPDFFEEQRATLCDWHYNDPVDELEYSRTFMIAEKQEDKVNPFILDCTLTARTYCSEVPRNCITTNTDEVSIEFPLFIAQPNPAKDHINIAFNLTDKSKVQLTLFDALGRKLNAFIDDSLPAGDYNYNIALDQYNTGFIIAQLTTISSDGVLKRDSQKIMIH